MNRIALGGGCHWCTEAVFQSLKGVENVEQGFISSIGKHSDFSEAVILHFDPQIINLKILVEIHLHTHQSMSDHSMRNKYRSAVYTFTSEKYIELNRIMFELKDNFPNKLITKVLPFADFKSSDTRFHNYYSNNPDKSFCKTHIEPKLKLLLKKFSRFVMENSTFQLDEEKSPDTDISGLLR